MERANQMRRGNVWGQPVGVHSVLTNPYNNDVSTHATITQMRQYAHQCARHPVVVNAVMDALGGAARSQRDIADALFYWVRHNVEFTEAEFTENHDWIKRELKREMYITGFSFEESQRVAIEQDPEVMKAIDSMPKAQALLTNARKLLVRR